jgi:hypothetical protein
MGKKRRNLKDGKIKYENAMGKRGGKQDRRKRRSNARKHNMDAKGGSPLHDAEKTRGTMIYRHVQSTPQEDTKAHVKMRRKRGDGT